MKVNKQTDKREHAGTATYIYTQRDTHTYTLWYSGNVFVKGFC